MKKSSIYIILMFGLLALSIGLILKNQLETPRVAAAPTVLAGPLQGGCYLSTPQICKLTVEPFKINVTPAENLLSLYLTANEQIIYDFAASIDRPILGDYSASPVALDFAAQCGEDYTIKLYAMDTGDLDYVTIGETQAFSCPTIPDYYYLPLLIR